MRLRADRLTEHRSLHSSREKIAALYYSVFSLSLLKIFTTLADYYILLILSLADHYSPHTIHWQITRLITQSTFEDYYSPHKESTLQITYSPHTFLRAGVEDVECRAL